MCLCLYWASVLVPLCISRWCWIHRWWGQSWGWGWAGNEDLDSMSYMKLKKYLLSQGNWTPHAFTNIFHVMNDLAFWWIDCEFHVLTQIPTWSDDASHETTLIYATLYCWWLRRFVCATYTASMYTDWVAFFFSEWLHAWCMRAGVSQEEVQAAPGKPSLLHLAKTKGISSGAPPLPCPL